MQVSDTVFCPKTQKDNGHKVLRTVTCLVNVSLEIAMGVKAIIWTFTMGSKLSCLKQTAVDMSCYI